MRWMTLTLLVLLAPLPAGAQSPMAQGTASNVWVLDANGQTAASYNVAPGAWTEQATPSGMQTLVDHTLGSSLVGFDPADFGAVLVNQTEASLPPFSPGVPRVSLVGLGGALGDPAQPDLPSVDVSPGAGTYSHTVEVVMKALPAAGIPHPDTLTLLWDVDGGPQQSASLPAESRVYLVADGAHTIHAQAHATVGVTDYFSPNVTLPITLSGAGAITRDTDGDGVPDVFEAAHGLNPLTSDFDLDSDGDGWSDFEEAIRGTDPHDPLDMPVDTDGDGWSDFDENVRGTDPNDPAILANPNDPQRFFPSRPVARRLREVEYLWTGAFYEDDAKTQQALPLAALSVLGPGWVVLFDQDAIPTAAELADVGLLEGDLPPWLRESEITTPLSAGDVPPIRTPGGEPNLIQAGRVDGQGSLDGWVAKAWVDAEPDLVPAAVIDWLSAQSMTFTTATEWENAYVGYLMDKSVQARSVDVTPSTTASLALVESVVAWYAQVPPESLLLLGDPLSGPQPGHAVQVLGDVLATENENGGRSLDDLHAELAAQLGLAGVFESFGAAVSGIFAGFDPLLVPAGTSTTELVASLLQGDPLDDDALARYHARLYAEMSQAELDALDPAARTELLDPNGDSDGDGIPNDVELTPPPEAASDPNATNSDGDLYSDDVDPCPDEADNKCLMLPPQTVDSDGDGIVDSLDNCLADANPAQEDALGTGVGDACRKLANIEQPVYHPTILIGTPLAFTSTAQDPGAVPPLVFDWDFGDGQTSTDPQPGAIVYTAPGVYVVTLTVEDANLSQTVDTRTVTVVGNAPGVDAGGPYVGVEGQPLQLTATGSSTNGGIVGFDWDFDDLTQGSGNPVVHVYAQDGVFAASVTATDGIGLQATDPATVTVQDSVPQVSFDAEPAGDPASLEILFTDTSSAYDGIALREWDFGDASPLASGPAPSHIYAQPGLYDVSLTVTDGDGSIATSTVPIQVGSPASVPALSPLLRLALVLALVAATRLGLRPGRGSPGGSPSARP